MTVFGPFHLTSALADMRSEERHGEAATTIALAPAALDAFVYEVIREN